MKPEQIQIIVDCECSHQERASLLRQLDNEVDGWRTLALALLEDKEWSRQLGAISHLMEYERVPSEQEVDQSNTAPAQHFVQTRSRTSFGYTRPFLSALAASVLVLIGFFAGSGFRKEPVNEYASRNQAEPNLGVNNMIAANGADGMEGMRLLWPSAEGGSIPLYDGKQLDPTVVWAKDESEFNRMNEQLRQRGFELERVPELYTGTLNDGRRLIIPVNKVDLKPYGY